MIETHSLHPRLLSEPVDIHLVGCGGNGSQMLTGLARLDVALRALNHPGFHVTAFDPDSVSAANIGRQLFAPADVGLNKATVLIHRLNAFYGLPWSAEPTVWRARAGKPHIVISCVDTRAARAHIHHVLSLQGWHPFYWMDLGNRAADGQVVLGIPAWNQKHARNPLRLPTAAELFPEIADTRIPEDNTPSCSLAEALGRQELFVNQAVVTAALQLLWGLFRTGQTDWHGAFVNLKSGRMAPLAVDREAWKRLGFEHRPRKNKK
ncbi:MAG TPA: PRTRC system ThiF family protein [Burkholderiales bacterium]|nr:PRTRC system ThiF family protein [Burkholderiales bacterium]